MTDIKTTNRIEAPRVGIVGGETHIGEVTALRGDRLEIVGACVRPDQAAAATAEFGCPVLGSIEELLDAGVDIVAVAGENDKRMEAVLPALDRGCDVIVDKPLCIHAEEQDRVEALLEGDPARRLLMLLTLRGEPAYVALRNVVKEGRIGDPVFTHIRMAVRLKRDERPPWFLDSRRSGGLFLDLLIHGLDYLEWLTGRRVVRITAETGNLGNAEHSEIRDHASVYCRMDDGGSAVVEGQRMLPDSRGSDYRVHVAGTRGYADMDITSGAVTVTDGEGADTSVAVAAEREPIVLDWLDGGNRVPQASSLRANRLALMATASAAENRSLDVPRS